MIENFIATQSYEESILENTTPQNMALQVLFEFTLYLKDLQKRKLEVDEESVKSYIEVLESLGYTVTKDSGS